MKNYAVGLVAFVLFGVGFALGMAAVAAGYDDGTTIEYFTPEEVRDCLSCFPGGELPAEFDNAVVAASVIKFVKKLAGDNPGLSENQLIRKALESAPDLPTAKAVGLLILTQRRECKDALSRSLERERELNNKVMTLERTLQRQQDVEGKAPSPEEKKRYKGK